MIPFYLLGSSKLGTRNARCCTFSIELGEQGLTPASSQMTYLLLLTLFLLVSLSYYYTEYKNDYPFHSITFFMPWRLRLCGCYVIS